MVYLNRLFQCFKFRFHKKSFITTSQSSTIINHGKQEFVESFLCRLFEKWNHNRRFKISIVFVPCDFLFLCYSCLSLGFVVVSLSCFHVISLLKIPCVFLHARILMQIAMKCLKCRNGSKQLYQVEKNTLIGSLNQHGGST